MSTLGTNYGVSELRIALALEDAINNYLVNGTMPNEGTLYGISEKRLAIAIAENTNIGGGGGGSATWGGINGTLSNQADLATALSLKQNSLISGTNIKTINSNSLLGSGDLSISAIPAGSSGQIQFNNAGVFGANSQLFWDNTNNKLGINNVSPSAKLDLVSSSATNVGLSIKGAINQSANLWECRDSTGSIIAYFNPFLPSDSTFLKFQGPSWDLNSPFLKGTLLDISAGGQNILKLWKNTGSGDETILDLTSATGSQFFRFQIGAGSISMSRSGSTFLQSGGSGTAVFPVAIEAGSTTQTTAASGFFTARATNLRAIIGKRFSAASAQNIIETQDENNTTLSVQSKVDGSYQPASLTDASATNNSAYFSLTSSRLTYKDSGGGVNSFSGINTGDQSSIVGITGTTSQFNTALTDGDFTTLAGTETLTNKVIVRKLSTKTTNYTLTNADSLVRFDGTNLTATLPDATTLSGYEFEIKNVNTTNVTVNTTSSQLIDANLTVILTQYEALKIVSNGTSWDVI